MKSLTLGVCLLASCLATGCVSVKPVSVMFEPAAPMCSQPKAETIMVLKPKEGRPLGGRSAIGAGLLSLIPLMPYGHQQFTPERFLRNATMTYYDFHKDLGETVTKDLAASGIGRKVLYVDSDTQTETTPGTYYLNLKLTEGIWHRYFTTYGLSIAGAYLWLVGAPVSYGHVQLDFEAELKDASNNVLAHESFQSAIPFAESAYGTPNRYPSRLTKAYAAISTRLRDWVATSLVASDESPPGDSSAVSVTQPPPAAVPANAETPAATTADPKERPGDRLQRLDELKRSGLITEEEYRAKRQEILETL
jgi:hypothetical protein